MFTRVRNCAFLVANATKNFALATRISQLVASGRLTIFHATIIIQTITLISSQIDKNKIQSRPPIGHLLFTFPLLLKYKTDFPVNINLSQRFTARAVRSFAAMFFEREMLHGCGLVRTTWRSVDRLDRTRKERSFTVLNIEQRTNRQFFNRVHFFSKR